MMVFLLYLLANTGVAVDLDEAYQREFAYLRAEKEALQERLTQLKAESLTRAADAETEVQRLQTRLMGLRTERTLAEDVLLDAEPLDGSVAERLTLTPTLPPTPTLTLTTTLTPTLTN